MSTSIFFVEVKTSDGELSPGQIREHKRLRGKNVTVCTVYGHVGVDKLMREVETWITPSLKLYR